MRSLVALSIGLMMLVSAAAAASIGNDISVDVDSDAFDNCVVGVDLAQVTLTESFVMGCGEDIDQMMDFDITANDLVGIDEDEDEDDVDDTVSQVGVQIANATGTDNLADQFIDFDIIENCLTDGVISQAAAQNSGSEGCENDVYQATFGTADDNDLVFGELAQMSEEKAYAVGTDNCLDQLVDQYAFDNCLVESSLWQQAAADADALGCGDVVIQTGVECAEGNDLTLSMQRQLECLDADVIGAGDEEDSSIVNQFALTDADDNCLVNAGMLQSINEMAATLGCGNFVDHDVDLVSDENDLVGGTVVQDSTVISNA